MGVTLTYFRGQNKKKGRKYLFGIIKTIYLHFIYFFLCSSSQSTVLSYLTFSLPLLSSMRRVLYNLDYAYMSEYFMTFKTWFKKNS